MPAINAIAIDKLIRLIGTPACPAIVDIRSDTEFAAAPLLVPGAVRRSVAAIEQWGPGLQGLNVVIACADGTARSHGAAAWLRQAGVPAEALDGGVSAWVAAGHPAIVQAVLPARDMSGRTLWVTRARPKVDRIACPWLIRRFVDPGAQFLFVPTGEVPGVAAQMGATPFDIEGVEWSHRGELCTFDVMVEAFGLGTLEALARLALIVRGADTDRLDLVPEAAGLLAVSLGLSRMFADDLEQLDAGLALYDALYRWCRDATGETHDWTSHASKKSRKS
jgi:rhodanese-related sulfurtransferase